MPSRPYGVQSKSGSSPSVQLRMFGVDTCERKWSRHHDRTKGQDHACRLSVVSFRDLAHQVRTQTTPLIEPLHRATSSIDEVRQSTRDGNVRVLGKNDCRRVYRIDITGV